MTAADVSTTIHATTATGQVVPPRVVPLFIHELNTTSKELQMINLKHFYDNLHEVFSCKVEVEDTMDLFVTSMQILNHRSSSTSDLETQLLLLRLLLELFTKGHHFSPLCFKALRRLCLEALRAQELKKEEAQTGARPDSAVAGLSPIPRGGEGEEGGAEQNGAADQQGGSAAVVAFPEDFFAAKSLKMDAALSQDITRPLALELLKCWDAAGIDIANFTAHPETLHMYVPHRLTSPVKVHRDFITCTRRPKLTKEWGSHAYVHIKTSIPAKSDVMYRFLIEGYNYGVNSIIHSDVVGYTNRRWDKPEPDGDYLEHNPDYNKNMIKDHVPGVETSQYYTKDKYLALKLKAVSMFGVGFSVSAWLVFHGYGNGLTLSAEIFHQDEDL